MAGYQISEFSLPSSREGRTLSCAEYLPRETPFAALQIVHGLCESKERYAEAASFFCQKGMVVCLYDQLGHGKTSPETEEKGFFAEKDGEGCLMRDIALVKERMRQKYRFLPYFILGQDIGGAALCSALIRGGLEADGAIFASPLVASLPFGKAGAALKALSLFKGKKARPEKIWQEWKSRLNGPFPGEGDCAFYAKGENGEDFSPPTISACEDILSLLKETAPEEAAASFPLSLPVLIAVGGADPLGGRGEAGRALKDALEEAGVNDLTLWEDPAARHALHAGEGKEAFFEEVAGWIRRVSGGVVEARTGRPFPEGENG